MAGARRVGGNPADILIHLGPTLTVDIGFDPTFKMNAKAVPIADVRGVQAQVASAHGTSEANLHLAQIHCPELKFTMYGRFAALDLIAGGQPYHALIGRTFLKHMRLIYDGKAGKVELIKI